MEEKDKIIKIEIIAIASEKLEDIEGDKPSTEEEKDFILKNSIKDFHAD